MIRLVPPSEEPVASVGSDAEVTWTRSRRSSKVLERPTGGRQIEPSQLDDPTPCSEWTVRDVLNHITGGAKMFRSSRPDGVVTDEKFGELMVGDKLGDDYKASFHRRATRPKPRSTTRALDKMVKLPFGEMPAGAARQHRDLRRRDAHVGSRQGHRSEHRPRPRGARRRVQGRAEHADRRPPRRGLVREPIAIADDAPAADRLAAFAGRAP